MSLWSTIADQLSRELGQRPDVDGRRPMGGGCISPAYRIDAGGSPLFVKTGSADEAELFAAEADALALLAEPGVVRVPRPVTYGADPEGAFLVMEFIAHGRGGPDGERLLGEGLALIHKQQRDAHGWDRDNVIGSTPQPNRSDDDWARFFASQRLGWQLELVEANGGHTELVAAGRRLQERLGAFFSDYTPTASLLHGDLWGGNAAFDEAGRPVIFDPATYYGDRESDLAMTELFGGFGRDFYDAYQAAWPLDAGYRTRRDLYQLYHVLNHLNLFGGMYAGQARRLIDRLLASAG